MIVDSRSTKRCFSRLFESHQVAVMFKVLWILFKLRIIMKFHLTNIRKVGRGFTNWSVLFVKQTFNTWLAKICKPTSLKSRE